jgi:predicted RNA-binding Zn ribbon-like protein
VLNSKRTSFFAASPGNLCLAFANTSYWRGTSSPTETLQRLEDLLRWATEAGFVTPELVRACRAAWQPNEADRRLAEAIVLREAIYRLFAATAANSRLPETDLAALNEALRAGPSRSHLSVGESQCRWRIDAPKVTLATLLAPIVWSAGDLLAAPCLARVRVCAKNAVTNCSWTTARAEIDTDARWAPAVTGRKRIGTTSNTAKPTELDGQSSVLVREACADWEIDLGESARSSKILSIP